MWRTINSPPLPGRPAWKSQSNPATKLNNYAPACAKFSFPCTQSGSDTLRETRKGIECQLISMRRFYYAIAILCAFLAILWVRIRVGPFVALCLVGFPIFIIACTVAYYLVCAETTTKHGPRSSP